MNIKFFLFPRKGAPNFVRMAVGIYWITFFIFVVRIPFGVGIPPFDTPREVEGAITVFVLLAVLLIFDAFTIMQISAGELWARNGALLLTAFIAITAVYHFFTVGLSFAHNNVLGILNVFAAIMAALLLLAPESTAWFKSKTQ